MSKTAAAPVEMTARQELEEIGEVLREADEAEKAAKTLKDDVKGPFFELISEVVREEVALATKVVTVELPEGEDFDSERWRAYNEPLWNIVGIQPEADGKGPATRFVITLEESDQFKKFEFVVNGYKMGRSIRMDGKGFDVEDFLAAVKERKLPAATKKALLSTVSMKPIVVYDFDEAQATALMAEQPETVAIFQEFINPGTPKAALLPIKEVKEKDA